MYGDGENGDRSNKLCANTFCTAECVKYSVGEKSHVQSTIHRLCLYTELLRHIHHHVVMLNSSFYSFVQRRCQFSLIRPSNSTHIIYSELQLSVIFGKGGHIKEVGSERWTDRTLNSGKTRPCFPAESAHYKTV